MPTNFPVFVVCFPFLYPLFFLIPSFLCSILFVFSPSFLRIFMSVISSSIFYFNTLHCYFLDSASACELVPRVSDPGGSSPIVSDHSEAKCVITLHARVFYCGA